MALLKIKFDGCPITSMGTGAFSVRVWSGSAEVTEEIHTAEANANAHKNVR
jgi:hypothetical protein